MEHVEHIKRKTVDIREEQAVRKRGWAAPILVVSFVLGWERNQEDLLEFFLTHLFYQMEADLLMD